MSKPLKVIMGAIAISERNYLHLVDMSEAIEFVSVDSFQNIENEIERIDALNAYIIANRNIHPDTCIALNEYAFQLSKENKYKLGEALCVLQMGYQDWQSSSAILGLEQVDTACRMIAEIKAYERYSDVFAIKAMIIWGLGSYDQSIGIVYETMQQLEEVDVESRKYWLYWVLGVFYYDLKDYDKSRLNYERSIAQMEKEEIVDNGFLGYALIGLGTLSRVNGKDEEALDYLCRVRDLSQKIGHWTQEARTYYEAGNLYVSQGDFDKAETELKLSYEMRKSHNSKPGMVSSLIALAELECERNDEEKAMTLMLEALEEAEETNARPKIYQCHQRLYRLYREIEDYENAFYHLEKFHEIKSEVEGDEARNKLRGLESQYERERTDRENEIHRLKHVELKEAHDKITEKNRETLQSIEYAKRIQFALIPPLDMFDELLSEAMVFFQPRDIVTGDFYFIEETDDRIYFAVADCTGHGVPGAIVSIMCGNSLTKAVREVGEDGPGAVLDYTLEQLQGRFIQTGTRMQEGMDIALCAIVKGENRVEFAGANNPLYLIRNGELIEHKGNKQPVGAYINSQPFNTVDVPVQKGDWLYVFSDGYADQFGGPNRKKFKYLPFQQLLTKIHSDPADKQRDMLESTLQKWMGPHDQVDDICILGVKI